MPPKKAAAKATKNTKGKAKAVEPAKPARSTSRKASSVTAASTSKAARPTAPVKPVAAIKKQAAATKSTTTKKAAVKETVKPAAKKATATKKTTTKEPAKAATKVTEAVEKKPAASNKRKATEASDDEPATKKARSKTPTSTVAAAKKATTTKKAAATATKKAPTPKKAAIPKPPSQRKFGPAINAIPTTKFDVYVCGEGGAGELGLGAMKFQGKSPIDVKRPRINHLLAAKTVGVVSLAVGGMHCAALTHDNKIFTWGVNDNGALGRETSAEGKMRDITKADGSESDSDDDDDDDSGLNPSESEPREVDSKHFPEGTKFTALVASDSATFAITEEGLVYGWGTFRGNDGVLGFRADKDTQRTPILIPELKQITELAAGTNHILALNKKGKVFAWGAGEQNQLARRVVQRTSAGALIPREFGLKGETVHIGCGDYHSFAVNKDGTVRAWGLNSWGECGVPKDGEGDNDIINIPTVVESLKDFSLKQVDGGGHHSIAVTESGQVLTWGRIDLSQGGMEPSKFPKDSVFFDDDGKPRYLAKPAVIPNINGEYVSAGTDSCLVVTKEGKAYSWGFSTNYQTGQGDVDDVKEATLIDNSAVRGKKLVWAGAGGQFSVLCGEAEDVIIADA